MRYGTLTDPQYHNTIHPAHCIILHSQLFHICHVTNVASPNAAWFSTQSPAQPLSIASPNVAQPPAQSLNAAQPNVTQSPAWPLNAAQLNVAWFPANVTWSSTWSPVCLSMSSHPTLHDLLLGLQTLPHLMPPGLSKLLSLSKSLTQSLKVAHSVSQSCSASTS